MKILKLLLCVIIYMVGAATAFGLCLLPFIAYKFNILALLIISIPIALASSIYVVIGIILLIITILESVW